MVSQRPYPEETVSAMEKHRILVLGGTTEARGLCERLAGDHRLDITLSLAGRTIEPRRQAVPVRMGGFGGAEGLAQYLVDEKIRLLVDATHPFAVRISGNAIEACRISGIPLFCLRRSGWVCEPGDNWTRVSSIAGAVEALGNTPRRVFLAIGRQEAHHFSARPEHAYIVRSVDPVVPPLDVPDARYILDCGPFDTGKEMDLLREERIDVIIAKNSGGSATYGKIAAARALGIAVIMIERAATGEVETVGTVDAACARIAHLFSPDMNLGV